MSPDADSDEKITAPNAGVAIPRPHTGLKRRRLSQLGRLGVFVGIALACVSLSSLAAPPDEGLKHKEHGVAGDHVEAAVEVDYSRTRAPPAPRTQSEREAALKSEGCLSCHNPVDQPSMHASPAVVLGCVDCHGGDPKVVRPQQIDEREPDYRKLVETAHVAPRYPKSWSERPGANPVRSYVLLNRESPEFIRFVNPSDYRVAREACGSCHLDTIQAAERSLMATGAMLWGGASYNNGILPFKSYILGEAYTRTGEAATLLSPGTVPGSVTPEQSRKGALPSLSPMPTWQVIPPADVFRVFERGGRNIQTQFPEIGLPNSLGQIQRLEEPGRPDIRQSNRGPATGLRVAIPALNIHKTRLNDPFTWFMGTNDQPGDYRSSGCSSCHVVYANDREPRHALSYAAHGRDGQSAQSDPTTPRDQSGHPLKHAFTRAIPTSQCMSCHMHQPNVFLNSYLGYTMWDYESDAPSMWPTQQVYPDAESVRSTLDRNPEGAAPRGKWADLDFTRNVVDINPTLKDTQFADYHGHGWNFRAAFKRDRKGNLLDAQGAIVSPDDPEKWRRTGEGAFTPPGINPGKAVHLMSAHAEVGMQCADCHFSQDSHGTGLIHGEVANAIEIACKDCHGSADAYPSLRTSGPAARTGGSDLSVLRNPDGRLRFEWIEKNSRRVLVQRSIVDPKLEWEVSLVKDSVDPATPGYNPKAARAKLMARLGRTGSTPGKDYSWGSGVAKKDRAHNDDEMTCYTCHLSWTPTCGGCHLPIESNWATTSHKYGGGQEAENATTRNYATYNPQVARDDAFQLGRHQTTKGSVIAPVRSSSALVLSSTNINRERIYVQQPPISAAGFSSQAFAPHYPHTERRVETKTCSDCHVSEKDDNNAIMAQLLLLGTNFMNFVGLHAYVGEAGALQAVRVTEWSEPQAVIGSYLHRYAYPDYYKAHVEANGRELIDWVRGQTFDAKAGQSGETQALEPFRTLTQLTPDGVSCLQVRGEYLFAAEGRGGFRVYDVASIANKGVSDPILSSPVSPLGQNTRVASRNATCMALPTNQPIDPIRNRAMRANPALMVNEEQALHPIYSYAAITDALEGLILVNVETFADGEPRNNFIKRAVTFNPGGVLTGARHITLAGPVAYIATSDHLAVVDLEDPLKPVLRANLMLKGARATAVQFRYLFATAADGLHIFDITKPLAPVERAGAFTAIPDARKLHVARTYAYVAAGAQGLVIVDVERPLSPRIYMQTTLNGALVDTMDVVVASTNASLFAYVADGAGGLKVVQLTSPETQPNFYGFSPEPKPELIAYRKTQKPALSLSRGLDRDRAVDETGGQIAIFGRLGSRPFNRSEMEGLFLRPDGSLYQVSDTATP
jgi:hypothetical protein